MIHVPYFLASLISLSPEYIIVSLLANATIFELAIALNVETSPSIPGMALIAIS